MRKYAPANVSETRVVGGGIHDAVVHSFNYSYGETFEICLRSNSHGERRIQLVDIRKIGFHDVVEGTIISDIFVWRDSEKWQNVPSEVWVTLFGGNVIETDMIDAISRLKNQFAGLQLVYFQPSYGGSITALCREIHTSEPMAPSG